MGKCSYYKSAAMGANPEDFPEQAKDLLLSGRVRRALKKVKSKLQNKTSRRRALAAIATGGMSAGFKPRTRQQRKNISGFSRPRPILQIPAQNQKTAQDRVYDSMIASITRKAELQKLATA